MDLPTRGIRYGTLLTLIHFIVTAIGMEICARLKVFERKELSFSAIMPLVLTFAGFVVLTNLSLLYNSVGFYQLTKVLTTPCIIVIQLFFYQKSFTLPIYLSLLFILAGITIVTVTDVQLNLLGTVIAFSGVFVTSLYQIWVNTSQSQLQANSMQLLYYQSFYSAIFLAFIFPSIDGLTSIYDIYLTVFSSSQLIMILVSALLAFVVNLSTYFVIGNTSPVTYNVVGHFKTCVILFGGFLLFHYPLEPRNIFGVSMTMFGIILYTYFKLRAS